MTANRRTRLPAFSPVAERWDRHLAARCRDEDPAVFYGAEGEHRRLKTKRQQRAKSIYAQCTVVAECLRHAVAYQERRGVWGAPTEAERGHVDRRPR